MTELQEKIVRLIAHDGPMSVAEYMRHCLTDPQNGYYVNKQPLGAGGDFTTAPEISQLFGELIGIWCVDIWQKLGKPTDIVLAELGPGRGILIQDCVRTLQALAPQMLGKKPIYLLEINPKLRELQTTALAKFGIEAKFISTLDELPKVPTIILANEFLDALPVHQFQFQDDNWSERCVGLGDANNLEFGLQPTSGIHLPSNAKNGGIFEFCPEANNIVRKAAGHLEKQTGAALFIDYGHLKSGFGDTFQAVKNQQYANPLEDCGDADLTFHVDFAALEQTVARILPNSCFKTTQGAFLLAMGLLERAGALGASQDNAAQEIIRKAVERLAAPDEMGDLFKVLALTAGHDKIDDGSLIPHGFNH